jgi:hypothetical protein
VGWLLAPVVGRSLRNAGRLGYAPPPVEGPAPVPVNTMHRSLRLACIEAREGLHDAATSKEIRQ